MARPFKSGVDYFPLDVSIDDKIEILEAEHGVLGFGIWVKLLQKIYANNYWIKWDNKAVIVFSNRINVDKNSVIAVINTCIEWNIFSEKMLNGFQILTSRGIQKRFFEITKRRNRVEVIEDYLLVDIPVAENIILVNVDKNSVNVDKSTQRKGKERKKESKELIYTEKFLELWNNHPRTGSDKKGTFKKYNDCKKRFSITDEQIQDAVDFIVFVKEKENSMHYQLSNVLGQNYRDNLPDWLAKSEAIKKKESDRKAIETAAVEAFNNDPDNF